MLVTVENSGLDSYTSESPTSDSDMIVGSNGSNNDVSGSQLVSTNNSGPVTSRSSLGRPVSVGIPGPVPSSSPLGVVSRPVSVGIPGPATSSSPLGVVSRPVSVSIPGPVPSSSPLGVRLVSVDIPGPLPHMRNLTTQLYFSS